MQSPIPDADATPVAFDSVQSIVATGARFQKQQLGLCSGGSVESNSRWTVGSVPSNSRGESWPITKQFANFDAEFRDQDAGLFKEERYIHSPQSSEIEVEFPAGSA